MPSVYSNYVDAINFDKIKCLLKAYEIEQEATYPHFDNVIFRVYYGNVPPYLDANGDITGYIDFIEIDLSNWTTLLNGYSTAGLYLPVMARYVVFEIYLAEDEEDNVYVRLDTLFTPNEFEPIVQYVDQSPIILPYIVMPIGYSQQQQQ